MTGNKVSHRWGIGIVKPYKDLTHRVVKQEMIPEITQDRYMFLCVRAICRGSDKAATATASSGGY